MASGVLVGNLVGESVSGRRFVFVFSCQVVFCIVGLQILILYFVVCR